METQYRNRNIHKDALEFGLLSIVADGQKSSSAILEKLKQLDFQFEEANLFPILKKLSREGFINFTWVSKPGRVPQKMYTITDSGLEVLKALRQTWEAVNNNMNSILNI